MQPSKELCDLEYSASNQISEPLLKLIVKQHAEYPYKCLADQTMAKPTAHQQRHQQATLAAEDLKPTLSNTIRRAMELANGRGASNWLTSLPIEEFGFCLHKGAFTDALAIKYGWTPSYMEWICDRFGKKRSGKWKPITCKFFRDYPMWKIFFLNILLPNNGTHFLATTCHPTCLRRCKDIFIHGKSAPS